MRSLRLLVRQIRYENRAFWRNPAAAFFTFAFPLIFMFVFQAIFGDQVEAGGLTAAAFFTPAIVAFSIVNACFTNLAITVTTLREEGILKRVRGTPMPSLDLSRGAHLPLGAGRPAAGRCRVGLRRVRVRGPVPLGLSSVRCS